MNELRLLADDLTGALDSAAAFAAARGAQRVVWRDGASIGVRFIIAPDAEA